MTKDFIDFEEAEVANDNVWILGYYMYQVIYTKESRVSFCELISWRSAVGRFQRKRTDVYLLFSLYWKSVHMTLVRKEESVSKLICNMKIWEGRCLQWVSDICRELCNSISGIACRHRHTWSSASHLTGKSVSCADSLPSVDTPVLTPCSELQSRIQCHMGWL